jgi:hypothetical protein
MLVRKTVNDKLILLAKKCLCIYLFNIAQKTLEVHTTYIFWYKALGYLRRDLNTDVNVFSDGDLILSKPKDFDCDSCLPSKSIDKVPKSLKDHMKVQFNVVHSDVHSTLAIQSLSGNKYFVIFINEFSRYTWIYFVYYKSDIKSIF